MNALERFAALVGKLLSTQSRLEKEDFLREYKDDAEVLDILRFLYNPYTITGIDEEKVKEYEKKEKSKVTTGILSLIDYFKKNNTGRERDVRRLIAAANASEHREIVLGIIKRDLKLGIQNTTVNKVFGAGFVPKFDVMLAENFNDQRAYVEGKEFIITEKLDGVRCILFFEPQPTFRFRDGQAKQDLFKLQDQAINLPPEYIYDGELLLDNTENLKRDELYRATVSALSNDNKRQEMNHSLFDLIDDVKYKRTLLFNIFDMVDKTAFQNGEDPTPAVERKARIEKIIEDLHAQGKCRDLRAVKMQYIGSDIEKIDSFMQTYISGGGEGIMLNIAAAPYECKRTKNLLKVKQFNTADVLVLQLEEGTAANKGKLGAVIVKFIAPDNKEYTCKVGSGFKLEERDLYWQNPELIKGKIIEICYFEMSRNDNDDGYSLRFPTFKHIRNDKTDISMY